MIHFETFFIVPFGSRVRLYATMRDGGLRLVETHDSRDSAIASCRWWNESGRLA